METEPWDLGTDSGSEVRAQLRAFLKKWLFDEKYRPRLPEYQVSILEEGVREGAGITIRTVSMADPKGPWSYDYEGRNVVEDRHQIALFVKADKNSGGVRSVSTVFGILRSLFAVRYGTDERNDLEGSGVKECMESPQGLIVDDSARPDLEGVIFRQQINLMCNTDCYIT